MSYPRAMYAACMLAAMAIFLMVRRSTPKPAAYRQLPWWKRVSLGLAAFVGGVFGAKLPFALTAAGGVTSPWAWAGDGKTIIAGLAGAYLAVEGVKWSQGIRLKTGDTWAPPLALALAVGRWGCFFNGCCYGVATTLPWGIPGVDGVRRHPMPVYESIFHATMAVLLFYALRRGWLEQHRLKAYLIAYAFFRFLAEAIRPEPVWLAGLTFYQVVAMGLGLGLMFQWLAERPTRSG